MYNGHLVATCLVHPALLARVSNTLATLQCLLQCSHLSRAAKSGPTDKTGSPAVVLVYDVICCDFISLWLVSEKSKVQGCWGEAGEAPARGSHENAKWLRVILLHLQWRSHQFHTEADSGEIHEGCPPLAAGTDFHSA